MALDANPQNFLNKLAVPSFGTLRSTFPVIQGNTVTLQMEIPFEPAEVVLTVYDESSGHKVQDLGITTYQTNITQGKMFLYHLLGTDSTCHHGNFQYNFTLSTSDRQQVWTKQIPVVVIPTMPSRMIQLLRTLRTLLGDDALSQRAQVWTDLELLELLEHTLGEINLTPTFTCFSLENAPHFWGSLIAIGAEYHALRSLYNTEARESFNFSDDGISVDVNIRTEKYMNMINHLSGTYTQMRTEMKKQFRPYGMAFKSGMQNFALGNLRPFLVGSLIGGNY